MHLCVGFSGDNSYKTWEVRACGDCLQTWRKDQWAICSQLIQAFHLAVPFAHITAQFHTETEGILRLEPVDIRAVYANRGVIALLQMQTRDPKLISHTGRVESEATYTIRPDDSAMLRAYIAHLRSASTTVVSATKAGRRSRSREGIL
jgi:hypothetical protein